MNIKRLLLLFMVAAASLAAVSAVAQTVPVDVEFGYRWLDLKGDTNMYRTQLNERSGLFIHSLTMSTNDFDGHAGSLLDRFRLDISDLGSSPAGSLRLEADREGAYRLRVNYRRSDAFSALPAFANPFLAQGIVPGQHTYDRTRQIFDTDLELLTDRAIVPFVGFSYGSLKGPGTTTYHLGFDEFRLGQALDETDRELRLGASFHTSMFAGTVTQGWRHFSDDETLSLLPGAGAGNNLDAIFSKQLTASDITRSDSTRGSTPFTNAYVTASLPGRTRVIANYVHFNADSNGSESENATGTFADFALGRFFSGSTISSTGHATNTTWRGGARVETELGEGLDAFAGLQREHRDLDGTALIDTLFLNTVTFGGFDPKNILETLQTANSIRRDEDTLNAGVAVRTLGPFAVRAELRQTKQDVTVDESEAEIVVPGSQGGEFTRRIHTWDLSGTYAKNGLLIGASYRKDDADNPIFRTDYLNRDRYRLRASWSAPWKKFRIGATAERTTEDNDQQGISYNARIRQYAADAEIAPVDKFRLHASVSQYRADSNAIFRHPETFALDESLHSEDGKSREGGAGYTFTRGSIDASVSRFSNRGLVPFDLDRYRLRATVDLKAHTGLAVEWSKDKYTDDLGLANYDANRYGIFVRWHP